MINNGKINSNAVDDNAVMPICKYAAIGLAFAIINNIFSLTPSLPQSIFYVVVIFLSGILLMGGMKGKGNVSGSMWLLWIVMWLSIGVNYDEIDPVFQAPKRTVGFLAVFIFAAPWFNSRMIDSERMITFDVLNKVMLFIAVLSCAGRFLHFLPTDRQGFYLGCTHHSMVLAAASGISCVYSLHVGLADKNPKHRRFYILCFLAAFLVILFASSRTVLASVIMAILCYFSGGKSQKANNAIKGAMIMGMLFFIVSLAVPDALSGIKSKNVEGGLDEVRGYGNEKMTIETVLASREAIWLSRVSEISDFPIFGVGAHTVRYGIYDTGNGQIEPGNAWLYMFSSMGVFAFLLFAYIYFSSLKRVWKASKEDHEAKFIMALLVFFGFYMNGEAHITAVGEFTAFYFWLLIAIARYHDFKTDDAILSANLNNEALPQRKLAR